MSDKGVKERWADAEKAARLYRVTVEQAVAGILWVDANGRIVHANQSACRMLGYSPDELMEMIVFDIDPAYSPEYFKDEFWEKLRRKGAMTLESRYVRKDGSAYPAEVTIYHIELDGAGYACTFFRDISDRRAMETALRESESKLRGIINNHFQLTGLLSPEGSQLMANQTALDFIGVQEAEVIGKPFWETPWWTHSRELQERLKQAVSQAAEGQFVRYETTHPDAAGELHYLDFSINPLKDEEGRVRYLIPEARDITELKKTQEALQQALKEVNKLKRRLQEENIYLKEEIRLDHNFGEIIGGSPALLRALEQVGQVAGTDATVLVLGETGTGKELIARAIHDHSRRRDRPLVKVNCAALPGSLIESELFGHEKGAFTGALARKIGRFELAAGGTIFLDEIGELSLSLQVKLLRVLQEGEFERLGGTETHRIDVRVISATNRDLDKLIREGEFRQDLYYRLNVFPVLCPPLRERESDIPLLVKHFVDKYAVKTGKKIDTIPQKTMNRLRDYPWPGNVRELENIIERALVLSAGPSLEIGDWFLQKDTLPPEEEPIVPLREMEAAYVRKVLLRTGWRVSGPGGAAEKLGLKPTTLEARMKKLRIYRPK